MGTMHVDAMIDELIRRIPGVSRPIALEALKRAGRWIDRQSSFQFNMQPSALQLNVTQRAAPDLSAIATTTTPIDPGKTKAMLNVDGSPIHHIPLSDFWESMNYNLPTVAGFDTYAVQSSNILGDNTPHVFLFLPNQNGTAYLYYHNALSSFSDIADSSNSSTRFPPEFDDLVIDFAEAEERRVYDVGESWQLLMGRAQEQLKLLVDGYRTQTQQSSQLTDAQAKLVEQTQLGKQ